MDIYNPTTRRLKASSDKLILPLVKILAPEKRHRTFIIFLSPALLTLLRWFCIGEVEKRINHRALYEIIRLVPEEIQQELFWR